MSDITRTFIDSTYSVKVFNEETESIEVISVAFTGKVDTADFKKAFSKSSASAGKTLLKVLKVDYAETLYSMPESTFIKFGKVVDARSKETRNTVTKEIISQVAVCKVIDNETEEISVQPFTLPRKMTADEFKRFANKRLAGFTVIKVQEIKDINNLYYMPVDEFKARAEKLPPRSAVK